jgi:hypothetical protein
LSLQLAHRIEQQRVRFVCLRDRLTRLYERLHRTIGNGTCAAYVTSEDNVNASTIEQVESSSLLKVKSTDLVRCSI